MNNNNSNTIERTSSDESRRQRTRNASRRSFLTHTGVAGVGTLLLHSSDSISLGASSHKFHRASDDCEFEDLIIADRPVPEVQGFSMSGGGLHLSARSRWKIYRQALASSLSKSSHRRKRVTRSAECEIGKALDRSVTRFRNGSSTLRKESEWIRKE